MRIEKYKGSDDRFYWRAIIGKGQDVVADGSEGYDSMSNLTRAVNRIIKAFRSDRLSIRDLTAGPDEKPEKSK